jgi:hypothetical protein
MAASPRFVGLLLACPLLALILWQWQQLSQAIGLLSRSPDALATCPPLTPVQLETSRLCLGLPLLLLSPLQQRAEPTPIPHPTPAVPKPEPGPEQEGLMVAETESATADPETEPETESKTESDAAEPQSPASTPEPSARDAVTVEPEQSTEQGKSTELDEEIA